MLEHISNIIRRLMDRFYPPAANDEAFVREVMIAYWRYQFETDICNHCRDPWGYCCKCGNYE